MRGLAFAEASAVASRLREPRARVRAGSVRPEEVRFVRVPERDRVEMVRRVEELDHATQAPGGSCGAVGGPRGVKVYAALLLAFYDEATGECVASIADLMQATSCCRQTVADKLARLHALGLVERVRRWDFAERVVEGRARRQRVQLANAYVVPTLPFVRAACESTERTGLQFGFRVLQCRGRKRGETASAPSLPYAAPVELPDPAAARAALAEVARRRQADREAAWQARHRRE